MHFVSDESGMESSEDNNVAEKENVAVITKNHRLLCLTQTSQKCQPGEQKVPIMGQTVTHLKPGSYQNFGKFSEEYRSNTQ
jgi:hypothetical protein